MAAIGVCLAGSPAWLPAQPALDGHVSVLTDHLPAQDATEARLRLFAERNLDAGTHVRITLAGYIEGLLADRERDGRDAIIRPQDIFIDLFYDRFDIRAGMTRVVWGRLDELQPSDVVNPLDASRFLLEGRSEARRPVWLVRARMFLTPTTSVEGVVVPVFRAPAASTSSRSRPRRSISGVTFSAVSVCVRPLTSVRRCASSRTSAGHHIEEPAGWRAPQRDDRPGGLVAGGL